jgi:hypothetical protein
MNNKTYNINKIIDFANRAGFTMEEFEMNYEKELLDLSKRGISVECEHEIFYLETADQNTRIGTGIFTFGVYPKKKPNKPEPCKISDMIGMTLGYTDSDGFVRTTRVHVERKPGDVSQWQKEQLANRINP